MIRAQQVRPWLPLCSKRIIRAMTARRGSGLAVLTLAMFVAGVAWFALAQGEEVPNMIAKGSFEVTTNPTADADTVSGVSLGRYALAKVFSGELAGEEQGEMLTATTATDGSAGYVALERFTGNLHGREGTFVLQHSGTMHAAEQSLAITIVPESGTGELAGISGVFELRIDATGHHYKLSYELP